MGLKRRTRDAYEVPLGRKIYKSRASYVLMAPFLILFLVFVVIPILSSVFLSFTSFNMLQIPKFVGFDNYIRMFLEDDVFVKALRNTVVFAIITGPLGYVLSFVVAWLINELNRGLRWFLTLVMYAPTLAGNIYYIWTYIFSGDSYGYLNSFLLDLGLINSPIQWLTDGSYVLGVTIVVQMWISLGAGFLALRAGFQNIDRSQYEAGAIEGIKSRWQELIYITIPSMGPQLMFAAVMQIVSSFTAGTVSQNLVGFPSTDYKAHTIMNHAYDYGWIRYEMGYASAICMILFVVMYILNKLIGKVLSKYMD